MSRSGLSRTSETKVSSARGPHLVRLPCVRPAWTNSWATENNGYSEQSCNFSWFILIYWWLWQLTIYYFLRIFCAHNFYCLTIRWSYCSPWSSVCVSDDIATAYLKHFLRNKLFCNMKKYRFSVLWPCLFFHAYISVMSWSQSHI